MWQDTGRRMLATATAAVTTLQATWMPVYAVTNRREWTKDEVKGNVSDMEPGNTLGVGVGTQTSADTLEAEENMYTKVLVSVTDAPATASIKSQIESNKGVEVVSAQRPETVLKLTSNKSTDSEQNDTHAPTKAANSSSAEVSMIGMPAKPFLQTKEPAGPEVASMKPSLREYDPDAVINGVAETRAPVFLNQGINYIALIILAGFCCTFLLLWGRKRRFSSSSSLGAPGGAKAKGPTVQYTQVPDEQPLSHRKSDNDEYCDNYEEDTFATNCEIWDDWEGSSTQTQASQLNPFVSVPTSSSSAPLQQDRSGQVLSKLGSLFSSSQHQHVQCENKVTTGKDQVLHSSVESTSSTDSFEVLKDDEPTSNCSVVIEVEKEGESNGDLFSQFGMIPTFKKSAVASPTVADTSMTPAPQYKMQKTPFSTSSLPSAAETSAIFAAEVDYELNAEDDWGEDDEWVKGI